MKALVAAVVLGLVAAGCTSEREQVGTPSPGSGPSQIVSAPGPGRAFRCTARFPSSLIAPGTPTGVQFILTNLSHGTLEVPEGGGNGVTGYLIERDASGQVLQDTSHMHDGIIGGMAFGQPVSPHQSFELPAYDAPVLWPGPISITPVCPVAGTTLRLPSVTVRVGASGPAPSATDALARSLATETPTFDRCSPSMPGHPVTGLVPTETGPVTVPTGEKGTGPLIAARCDATVISEPGFDVVVLAAYTPPDAAPYGLRPLAYDISASPTIYLRGPEELTWRVLVVTPTGAVQVRAGTVAVDCEGRSYSSSSSSSSGVPFSGCAAR